MVLIDLVVY